MNPPAARILVADDDEDIRDLVASKLELGGYEVYGMLENIETIREEGLIPLGLAIGARANRAIRRDEPLRFEDLDRPEHPLDVACHPRWWPTSLG